MDTKTSYLVESIVKHTYADNCHDWIERNSDVYKYIINAYSGFDSAHDIKHVITVLANAYEIIARLKKSGIVLTDVELTVLPWTILMHDARDHKAVARGLGRPQEEINIVSARLFGFEIALLIEHIHNNCSWSKRAQSVPVPTNMCGISDRLRQVLCDADWIEAIGDTGLRRCHDYQSLIFPYSSDKEIERRVYDHALEKMVYVRDGLYFDATRDIVAERDLETPIHKFIADFEANNFIGNESESINGDNSNNKL